MLLWRFASVRSARAAPLTTELNQPTSVTVGPDGALYVTNNGNLAGSGQVLRIAQ